MHTRTKRLVALMAEHELTARDVSDLLECEPNTVRVWRVASAHRVIPAAKLELLTLKLELGFAPAKDQTE